MSEKITRIVVKGINRNVCPYAALNIKGRYMDIDEDVLKEISIGGKRSVAVTIFPLYSRCSPEERKKEYKKRNLIPVDPYALAKFVRDNPGVIRDRDIVTQWKDGGKKWCTLEFKTVTPYAYPVNMRPQSYLLTKMRRLKENEYIQTSWLAGIKK